MRVYISEYIVIQSIISMDVCHLKAQAFIESY